MSNRYVGGYIINERLIATSDQIAYTTPGTHSWICPENVTSVSVVCIGGGGGAGNYYGTGGGGGGLVYKNNISVTPGISYTVVVGAGGSPVANGSPSSFTASFGTMIAGGGGKGSSTGGTTNIIGAAGTFSGGDGGGNGGTGGPLQTFASAAYAGGGGGAGGYSGNGGNGGGTNTSGTYQLATAGSGGGGGGGAGWGPANNLLSDLGSGGGGGTGLLGQGTSGAAGTLNSPTVRGGGGGSGGNNGATPTVQNVPGNGGLYGGGGGSVTGNGTNLSGSGANGAVRIIWPGDTRTFPSTNTDNATFIPTSKIETSSTYASGVYKLSDYQLKIKNGLWPLFERYSFSNLNAISINEGANTTFSVNTTNVLTGTQLYWSILHNTSNSFDFISTGNTFTVTNNVGSFFVQTVADLSTEGTEYFQLQVQKTNANGEIVLTSGAITLSDTSVTPPPAIDVFLVGGGGGQYSGSGGGISGGGGGGAVLSSNNFTGFQFATTYTVTVAGGSSASASPTSVNGTLSSGPAGLSLISAGGQGGSYFSGGFVFPTSGGNGGGAAAITSSSRFNRQTYLYVDAGSAGTASLAANDQLITTYPGIFTYSGFDGLSGVALNSGTTFEMTNISWVAAGGGGGGAGGTFSTATITLAQNSTNINGRNGRLNSMDNNYYGGGGASYAVAYRNQQRLDLNGSVGLGGGDTANRGGGGGSGYSMLTGGSGVAFFKFETSKISASTTGTVTTTTSGIHTIVKFTSSGTINFTRI